MDELFVLKMDADDFIRKRIRQDESLGRYRQDDKCSSLIDPRDQIPASAVFSPAI